MKEKLSHQLEPGQLLSIIRPRIGEEQFPKFQLMRKLRLIESDPNIFVTYINEEGISIYIVRGHQYGGDIEAFILKENTNWASYFTPCNSKNHGYVSSKHYKRKFPSDFI